MSLGASYIPPLSLAAVSVLALVVSDQRAAGAASLGRFLFKPLAALAFIWLGLMAGAMDSPYGRWLLAGLLLSALGDLCLMFENGSAFLAGLTAFLCGHLLYVIAFLQLSPNAIGLAWMLGPAITLCFLSLLWLWPHVPGDMRLPVLAYVLVITAMLLAASLSAGLPGSALAIAGAVGFALSDLAVARNQFVAPGPANGLWGTPLYFASQLLLAASIAPLGHLAS